MRRVAWKEKLGDVGAGIWSRFQDSGLYRHDRHAAEPARHEVVIVLAHAKQSRRGLSAVEGRSVVIGDIEMWSATGVWKAGAGIGHQKLDVMAVGFSRAISDAQASNGCGMIDNPTIHFPAGVLDDVGWGPRRPNRMIELGCGVQARCRAAFIAPPECGGHRMHQIGRCFHGMVVVVGQIVFARYSSTHESIRWR